MPGRDGACATLASATCLTFGQHRAISGVGWEHCQNLLPAWFARRGLGAAAASARNDRARARGGQSALLVAPTGGGKTLAGFLPSLIELAERPRRGLHTLYIAR